MQIAQFVEMLQNVSRGEKPCSKHSLVTINWKTREQRNCTKVFHLLNEQPVLLGNEVKVTRYNT
jgi:hypothetical protein